MAYTGDPANVPTDAVRLYVGDVSPTMPILSDADYEYFLAQNNQNVKRSAIVAAQAILFQFSQLVEERIGTLEFNGGQAANNYRQALMMFLNNPNFSVALEGALPYAGGISKQDIQNNIDNTDNQVVDITRSIASEGDEQLNTLSDPNPFNSTASNRNNLFSI